MHSKKEKLMIIHLDDIGMSYASNMAAIELLTKGLATSASVMVPGAWSKDFINWTKENIQFDIGIHTTFTCEWETSRWRALSNINDVPGLYEKDGFMVKTSEQVTNLITVDQFKYELKLQINQAISWGLNFTHLDNHMWVVASNPEFFKVYLEMTKEYEVIAYIPEWILFNDEMKNIYSRYGWGIVHNSVSSGSDSIKNYKLNKETLFSNLKKIKEGLNILTIHPIIDTPEIRTIIPDWETRYIEYKLFMDKETKSFIGENNIRLTTWKEQSKGEKGRYY